MGEDQRALIIQYATELGIDMKNPMPDVAMKKMCNKCYTLNVRCCNVKEGECRSSFKTHTKNTGFQDNQKTFTTEFHREHKEEDGVTHGVCNKKVIDDGYKDCHKCKYHWAGGGSGLVWKRCNAYECEDEGGSNRDYAYLTSCSNDADDDCDWEKWVKRDRLSNIFGSQCTLGGKKKLCSTCSEKKALWCRNNE